MEKRFRHDLDTYKKESESLKELEKRAEEAAKEREKKGIKLIKDSRLLQMSNGNFNTTLNPINRHSHEGFALRRVNKANRKAGKTYQVNRLPIFNGIE
jgi:hypothetical protein